MKWNFELTVFELTVPDLYHIDVLYLPSLDQSAKYTPTYLKIMTSQLSFPVNVTQNININIINPHPDLTFMHSPSPIRMDTFTPGMWIGFGGRIGDRTISTVLKVKN